MKILILLAYYNRPKMVRNALNSIKESIYTNWELAIIDDGSEFQAKPVVLELFNNEELSKTKYYNTNDTIENKQQRGSISGEYINIAISESNADLVIILCDDDALVPDYLGNLAFHFTENPSMNYCYSHVIQFNPLIEDYHNKQVSDIFMNKTWDLNPSNNVDASQVCWKREFSTGEDAILFPSPQTKNLDATIFQSLFNKLGPCKFTGFYSQYKGMHEHQLGVVGEGNHVID